MFMIKRKILKNFSFILLSVFLISSTLFSGILPTEASQMTSGIERDNSMDKVINDPEENQIKTYPDLGDDQAFPFIPGFGKNSGKD